MRAPPSNMTKSLAALACLALLATPLLAQTPSPPTTGPGPTNPVPPNPMSKPGADIIINPTLDECRRGWSEGMRWTKEQFENFCTRLGASK